MDYATVSGGAWNEASGYYSTVPGGELNTAAGDYSFAAGRRAKANHQSTFVWADLTDEDFTSTGSSQFLIRASGGVGIGTTSPGAKLHVGGTPGVDGIMFPDGTLQTTANGMKTYDSGWFAVELDVTYTKAHNLGTTPFMAQLWFSDTADGSGDVVVGSQSYACAYKGIRIVDIDASYIKLRATNRLATYQNADGVLVNVDNGYARIKAIAF